MRWMIERYRGKTRINSQSSSKRIFNSLVINYTIGFLFAFFVAIVVALPQ
jgi:hypothetical protein